MQKKPSPSLRHSGILESLWSEPVERYALPNGLTVILKKESFADLASVQLWVKTGSIHEGALLGAGLSHFLEHMLFKGTEKRSGRQISELVQSHGGYVNAYTTFDRTVYYIDIPSEHTGLALDLLGDAVFGSLLPGEEVEKEKEVILREIAMGEDDPDQRLSQRLFETAFREHPYRHPIIGHREIFSEVRREDLAAYYQSRYVPGNAVLVSVGNFEMDAMREAVNAHFAGLPRRRLAPVYLPEEPAPVGSREHHLFEDVAISRCGLGYQIPGVAHADSPLLDVAASLLGHGESSLLWKRIREDLRLVHSIDACAWNPGTVGLLYISFTCDPDKRAEAITAVEKEIAAIARRGFAAAEIDKAIRQAVVSEVNGRKTMGGQAARLGVAEVVAGDLRYSETYFRRLFEASPAEFRRVVQTYLVPERLSSVSLNPTASAPAPKPARQTVSQSLEFDDILLPNGSRLLLQPNRRLPSVHFRMACLGGPMYESSDLRGATSLLSTLLTKDTQRRSAEEVAEAIEKVGGNFYDFCGNNSFGLALEVLAGDFQRGLQIFKEAVLWPALRKPRIETEREAHVAALKEDDDDVVTYGRKLLRQRFFGEHPLGIESGGTCEGVAALRRDDLMGLYRQLMISGNVVLAVAGDFSAKEARTRLKAFLSRLPSGRLAAPAAAGARPEIQAGDYVERIPRQQAVVYEGFPSPGIRNQRSYYVSEVLDELFSGMASELFERVREQKSLAYFIRSSRVVGLDTGMFYFAAGTAPGREEEVFTEIDRELRRVRDGGVTEQELRRCQTRLKAARRMSLQTNAARATQAALNAAYGLPVNDWKSYDMQIDAVSREDLQSFVGTELVPEKRVRLVVRP